MNKHLSSPVASSSVTAPTNSNNHLNNYNSHYQSSLFSSLKSNDATSSYNSSITNINNKSSSSNYSPSLTTANTGNTAGTSNSISVLNTDMIGSQASNNSSINTNNININNNNNSNLNNNNNSTSRSPLKQSFNRPLRALIGTTANGGTNVNTSGVTDKKIGHREVKDGVVHYKKVPTDELKKSIQFGIVHSISVSSKYADRDLIMQDFQMVETIVFPKTGTSATPAHVFNDFKLKVYAPLGFKYLRKKFNLDEADFMHSISETELKEISNPGASGSIFYKTSDDKYILKTVQYQECEFLKTLLAGIYLNLLQNQINNKYSLLPMICGLYCYQKLELTSLLSDKTNIRVVIMNNILPSDITMHEKYDLKGSLYKRKASRAERAKTTPTCKDLDFLDEHPEGITLDEKHYENIVNSLKRDCLVLKSFGIMDYSLLLGIHNVDKEKNSAAIDHFESRFERQNEHTTTAHAEQLHASNDKNDPKLAKINKVFSISAVPGRNAKGDRLLLYLGIIDILQSYRLKKRLEHTFKSMITDGEKISVCHPDFYEARFIDFITNKVFKKATLKSSPARRRTTIRENPASIRKDPLYPLDNTGQSQMSSSLNNEIAVSTSSSSPPVSDRYKNLKTIDSIDSITDYPKSPNATNSKSFSKLTNEKLDVIEDNLSEKKDLLDQIEIETKNEKSPSKKSNVTSIVQHYEPLSFSPKKINIHVDNKNNRTNPINHNEPTQITMSQPPAFNGFHVDNISTTIPINICNNKYNYSNDSDDDEIEMITHL